MLESVLVYGSVMALMMIFGKIAADNQQRMLCREHRYPPFAMPEVLALLAVFSIVFGARYDVGIDHLSYLSIYRSVGSGFGYRDDLELGFLLFTSLFAKNGFHFFFYFAAFAFMQVFFVFYAFRRERYLYPYLAFIIMSVMFLGWMNVMRQSVVICIFIWMIHFVREGKFLWYCLWTFLCSFFFHQSALLLLPVYFLLRIPWDLFRSIPLQIASLLSMIVLNLNAAVFSFFTDINDLMNFIGYDDRFQNFDVDQTTNEYSFGPRAMLTLFGYLTAIVYSKRLKKTYAANGFKLYYTLFYIGICLHTLFSGNYILQRPFLYFTGMMLPVYAFLIHYLWHRRKILIHLLALVALTSAMFLQFILSIYLGQEHESTLFQFFWQTDFPII